MDAITITAEEFKATKKKEGLEALLNRMVATAVMQFWKKSHPTILWMVAEAIPFLQAVNVHVQNHPEHGTPEFVAAAYMLKMSNPNRTPFEIIEMTAQQFELQKQAGDVGKK